MIAALRRAMFGTRHWAARTSAMAVVVACAERTAALSPWKTGRFLNIDRSAHLLLTGPPW
jgi:hypothetical protein